MKKKSVIAEWIICYFIILMIPIITIFVNYFHSVDTIKHEIYESNMLVLNNLVDNVDRILVEERKFYEHVLSYDEFKLLLNRAGKDNWFYYYVKEVHKEIASYKKWNGMSCLIYMFNTDYVIGKAGYSSDIYYGSMGNGIRRQMDYVQWMELLTKEYTNEFFTESYLDGRSGEQSLIYADSVQWGNYGKTNIFISIPVARIEQLTAKLEQGTSLVICVDGKPQLAVSSGGVEELQNEIKNITWEENSPDTEDYKIIRQQSSENKVEYFMLIPQRNFWKEFQYIRNLFYISLALTLMVGIFCVSLLVRRNYRPLSNLYKSITGGMGEGNEFQQVEKIYHRLVQENSAMHKRIITREEDVQRYYLMSLMKGWTELKQSEETVVNMPPGEKLVFAGLMPSLSVKNDREQDELQVFVVDNVFSELMEQENFCRFREDRCLFYLFWTPDSAVWKEQCIEKLRFLQTFLEEKWGQSIYAAVSKMEGDYKQLRNQYLAVTEALESASTLAADGVIDVEMRMQNRGIAKEVIEYIELHYTENNLNINSVAVGIKRSAKYISKVFKEETGKSILEYIHTLRIRKAQSLIQSGKYSLSEIYEQVGYTNDATFRRAFAKIVGMVPREYKESME